MHSHSDWVIPQPDHAEVLAPLLEQGITTIVAGNCGCSPAPYLPGNQALLPLVGRMLHDHDLDYGWSGMGSFLAALERRGLALNVAQLVGHGTVRAAVKGAEPGPATRDEVAAMADLVRAALDEGAIGLSTGLGYAPGVFADLDELLGVAAPLQERGGVYTSHGRRYSGCRSASWRTTRARPSPTSRASGGRSRPRRTSTWSASWAARRVS